MKKILILGASIWQIPAIEKAKAMGLTVVVADMNPDAVGFKIEGITCEIASTIDMEAILSIAKKHNIDGIMTIASDMPMRTIAAVSGKLNLVGISEETAFNATNKAAMRACLAKHGIPIPAFYQVKSKDEYYQAVKTVNGKVIVKPVDNAGSRGVSLITEKDHLDPINAAFAYAKECSRNGDIMVEEYMEGLEVSVETLSVNGKCHVIQITDKLTTGAPHFVEMGHNEPSMLPEVTRRLIAEIAIAAVDAIGIKDGPSHTEIKVTSEGPKIVEIGARLGGDNITTHLVPLSTGVDMVECCIHIALGEKPDLDRKFDKGSAIRYMETGVGKITEIIGLDKARAMPEVYEVSMVHGIGEEAVEVKNSIERVGFVISQSDTPENAIKKCEEALSHIQVIID